MSTNSGSNPAHLIAQALAVNVNEGTAIRRASSCGSPHATRSATIRPSVQLLTGMHLTSPT